MFKIVAKGQIREFNTPQIMAIMNATTDSFFEGSRISNVDWAIQKARDFIAQGASIIDVGGQSTRPGAIMHSPQEELENVLPIIEALRAEFPQLLISVDTFHSHVASHTLKAGADIINDISCGSFDDKMWNVVASHQAGYIGMHVTGTAATMHEVPKRENIITDLLTYFTFKKEALAQKGIHEWIIDPGFGFGKLIAENFDIVKKLSDLKSLALPILLGVSRKSSIYKTLNVKAEDALNGTTIVNTVGILNGASIIRVHDVKEAKQIIDLVPFLS